MIPVLVFDIETIPDVAAIKKIGMYDECLSDQQILDLFISKRIELYGNDFVPLHLHKIVAISCVFRNNQGLYVKTLGKHSDDEHTLLECFFSIINRYFPRLVSWNGTGFDLPVIHYRSMVNCISAPKYWDTGSYGDRDLKFNNYINRYHNMHLDLMDVLSKYNGRASVSMDELTKLCNFPGKIGMNGSKVWDYWSDSKISEIRSYCETDVVNTWLLYCRFCLFRGDISKESYDDEINIVKHKISSLDGEHWKSFLKSWNN
ncbi:3'-5' exonuclease [Candidatus Kinetoplastibacterium blastocrithidii (ex Strigomonas culicis)]|uniref:3'-5' exonuclease n=1 Tax=Candidatus Kinetoplastidibacterium blastocrithidiae TaxID=233181 RepID=UPI0002A66719|nr:3'-5' exonuclease [Candidatus Kinetoplastibacterium blastocrithidii]AFZ83581.1 3'-5' exonuclease [Candidatus Kinetoplastibacterium blastocrithidii (ex Strigomonas culicis)]